jgi:hypothetical protein
LLVSKEQFFKEVGLFREMVGNRQWSIEQLDNAFSALFYVYLRATATGVHPTTTSKDIDQMESMFMATFEDWFRRKVYMLLYMPKAA